VQGKYDSANQCYKLALEIRDEYYKNEPRFETAYLLLNLGRLCEDQLQSDCDNFYNRAAIIHKSLPTAATPEIHYLNLRLGLYFLGQGRCEEFIPLLEKFLKNVKQNSENQEIIAKIEYGLGMGYDQIGNHIESIQHFKNSLNLLSNSSITFATEALLHIAEQYSKLDEIETSNCSVITTLF
jgi:tetratricopeptide (TPR) repeat protein